MSLLQVVLFVLAVPALLIAAALIWGQVVAELHRTFNPNRDLEGEWRRACRRYFVEDSRV